MTAVAALCGSLLALGLLMTAVGLQPIHHPSTPSSTGLWKTLARRWEDLPARRKTWLLPAIAAGPVVYLLTGFVFAVFLVPALVLGVPWLLGDPPNREIELLGALDRWVRAIATSLPTGKSIKDAIRATKAQAPEALTRSITLLLARLDDRWGTREAFFAMADELDSPDADAVIAALALAAERGGTGATATLHALSDSIQDRLRAAREIDTERAKPRVIVRQITAISAVALVVALVTSQQFFAPYRTPLGQVVLFGLIVAYVSSLVMLRRMTNPTPRDRLIVWRHA